MTRIKLTEGELKRLVRESVKNVLREMTYEGFGSALKNFGSGFKDLGRGALNYGRGVAGDIATAGRQAAGSVAQAGRYLGNKASNAARTVGGAVANAAGTLGTKAKNAGDYAQAWAQENARAALQKGSRRLNQYAGFDAPTGGSDPRAAGDNERARIAARNAEREAINQGRTSDIQARNNAATDARIAAGAAMRDRARTGYSDARGFYAQGNQNFRDSMK